MYQMLKESPELTQFKEDKNDKYVCKHGLRCYEVDCELFHGLTADGRRILRKKFDKELKARQMREKICAEIKSYRKGVSNDWNTLDTRP